MYKNNVHNVVKELQQKASKLWSYAFENDLSDEEIEFLDKLNTCYFITIKALLHGIRSNNEKLISSGLKFYEKVKNFERTQNIEYYNKELSGEIAQLIEMIVNVRSFGSKGDDYLIWEHIK